MPYFPIYAFFDVPLRFESLEQMLVNGLGSYLPECETIKESSSVRERLALHLSSEDNDVVVRQLSSGVVAIDFWDFDPEVYDNDGPTPEMARQKRAVRRKRWLKPTYVLLSRLQKNIQTVVYNS